MRPVKPVHRVLPRELSALIRDVHHQHKGARVYYALDSAEIVDFCFPINPLDLTPLDIERIADDQAAFYEVFFVRSLKPILLSEYAGELRGLMNYFDHGIDRVYSTMEMLEGIIKAGGLEKITDAREQEFGRIIESNFNIILAVAMGLYSLGVDRFRSMFSQPLLSASLETDDPNDQLVIRELEDNFVRTTMSDAILSQLEKTYVGQEPDWERERRQRADKTDALAIDRLIYLNNAFGRAYEGGRLKRRYFILYLSSAPKTERIFNIRAVREGLPIVDGIPYQLWRTRQQVFAYVVHKSKSQDMNETADNLSQLQTFLAELERLTSLLSPVAIDCEKCVLKGGSPHSCEFIEFCKYGMGLEDSIMEARKEIENLGLFENINDYQRLLNVKPKQLRYGEYLHLFVDICNSKIRDVAMERMYRKQQWILIRSEAADRFKDGVSLGREDQRQNDLRSVKDLITGIDQYFPTKPRLKSPKYKSILSSILIFLKDPKENRFLEETYRPFLEFDSHIHEQEPEHDLVRCYTYLTFGGERGDETAYQFVKGLLRNQELIEKDPEIEREYDYVLSWVARRTGRFVQADTQIKTAIERWNDPRFYHARSLNIYSWLMQEDYKPACPYAISDAVSDAQKAIALYSNDEFDNRDVISSSYNNIAYFLAWEVTRYQHSLEEGREILGQSRQALDKLKTLIEKEKWHPHHPEYFHTEAYLEYQEYLITWASHSDKNLIEQKLRYAYRDIDTALQLYPRGPKYYQLKESIEKALDSLWSGRLHL